MGEQGHPDRDHGAVVPATGVGPDAAHRPQRRQHGVGTAPRAPARHVGRLGLLLALVVTFLTVEAIVGVATGSLAVLSQAGRMATDALGVAMSLAAVAAVARTGRSSRTSPLPFGLYRLELLAALVSSVLLVAVGVYVLVEAVRRVGGHEPLASSPWPVVAVGVGGLALSVAAIMFLREGAADNLDVRRAYLGVVSNALGSMAVILSGLLTSLFGWSWVDPLIGAGIGLLILPRAWRLGREAVHVLMQSVPCRADPATVSAQLAALDGVAGVVRLHIWALTSQMDVVTAHLAITPDADHGAVANAGRRMLADTFGLDHATVRIESNPIEGRGADEG